MKVVKINLVRGLIIGLLTAAATMSWVAWAAQKSVVRPLTCPGSCGGLGGCGFGCTCSTDGSSCGTLANE